MSNYCEALEGLNKYYSSGATQSYSFRRQQLLQLKKALLAFEHDLYEALYKDLHKSKEESYATELGVLFAEINHTLSNLKTWMMPQKVSTPLVLQPASSKIVAASLGVCFIVAPWNYPVNLLIAPLIGAMAGGNVAVLKPSELAPHTATVLHKMISSFFPKEYILVVEGDGAATVPSIIDSGFIHHVFFTGSTAVGKSIAQQTAKYLIPTVLELGGKSPCIVAKDASIKVAANRIVWGKFTNAGQTCVAPDYVLVHEQVAEQLIDALKSSIEKFYGANPIQASDYGRIIHQRRFKQLVSYLSKGEIVYGGNFNEEVLYIAPTIINNVSLDDPIMQEEIFGPILPVITYSTNEEACKIIQQNPNPLALYVFSGSASTQDFFIDKIAFGGASINTTLMHLGNPFLPFGGVISSGVGQYHGKYSFDTFTRPKAVLKKSTLIDPSIAYPPYKGKLKFLKWLMK